MWKHKGVGTKGCKNIEVYKGVGIYGVWEYIGKWGHRAWECIGVWERGTWEYRGVGI